MKSYRAAIEIQRRLSLRLLSGFPKFIV